MSPKIFFALAIAVANVAAANDRNVAGAVIAGALIGSMIHNNNASTSISTTYSPGHQYSSISYRYSPPSTIIIPHYPPHTHYYETYEVISTPVEACPTHYLR